MVRSLRAWLLGFICVFTGSLPRTALAQDGEEAEEVEIR